MHLFTFDKYEITGWYGISFWNLQAPWDLLVQSIDLLSEAALTCTADISSVHLSGFLKEYHGHKLVKNHVLLRGSQSGHVWRLPWRFRTVDFLGPILDFQRRKKETLKYFALTRMHTSELCDRRLAVYNSPALLSGSSWGLCAGLGAEHSCWGQVVYSVSACRAVRQWSASATCLYFGLE